MIVLMVMLVFKDVTLNMAQYQVSKSCPAPFPVNARIAKCLEGDLGIKKR
jgi:hypothetical protein